MPRQPVMLPSDLATAYALIVGMAACAAGLGMALAAAMMGVSLVTGVAVALVGAIIVGGIAAIIANRIINREKRAGLNWFMTERGIVLWVRVHSPEREDAALKILRDQGAVAARLHETEIDKTVEAIPLNKLRADPWLGDEPLAEFVRVSIKTEGRNRDC